MTSGGWRDDRDEWPDRRRPQSPDANRRPLHRNDGQRYDQDDPAPAYRTRPTDFFAPAPEPAAWPQQQYPEAYVSEPRGYVPERYEPSGPAGTMPGGPPAGDPGRLPRRNRPGDLPASPPDGRPRRPPAAYPPSPQSFAGQDIRGAGPSGFAGPDVRTTGQQPIYGPDSRGGMPVAPPGTSQPWGPGPEARPFGAAPWVTGQQQWRAPAETRMYGADPRATGSQPRIGADPRTTGSQVRVPMDPWTGEQIRAADEPPRRRGRRIVVTIIVLLVLAVLGGAGALYLRHQKGSGSGDQTLLTAPTFNTASIDSRKVDPKPLTVAEVFGSASIKPSSTAYQVVKSDAATSCTGAATVPISTLLGSSGCTQTIRATMLSSDQAYVITAGVINLTDTQAATTAAASIKSDLDGGNGRFNGLAAGGTTNVIAVSQARVAWDTRGHYLIYCVIALANGQVISSTDPRVPTIVNDIVEKYLGNTVLAARAHATPSTKPATTPSS